MFGDGPAIAVAAATSMIVVDAVGASMVVVDVVGASIAVAAGSMVVARGVPSRVAAVVGLGVGEVLDKNAWSAHTLHSYNNYHGIECACSDLPLVTPDHPVEHLVLWFVSVPQNFFHLVILPASS